MTRNTVMLVLIAAGTSITAAALGQGPENVSRRSIARITVDSGKTVRIDTPITVDLPKSIPGAGICLVEVSDGRHIQVPSQIATNGKGLSLCWVLSGKTPPATKRVYELERGKPEAGCEVEVRDNDSALEMYCGGKPVLRYKYGIEPAPDGKDKRYARSGFIHPVWSPAGQVLTQIHPADHIHHMGLWNAWTATEFEGRHVDFWNIRDGKGTVRFAKCLQKTSGPVFGGFKVTQEHVDLSTPGGEKVVLNDELEVRVWRAGQGVWLFDWVSAQRCASSSPLHLLKYRYGGLGFRATLEWGKDNSEYLTSEGKTRKDGHGSRERWAIMSGKTSKGVAGLLVMADPRNREYPEPVRIWGTDNQAGHIFFNFCPIQQKEWILEPEKEYVSRYRICTFDGEMGRDTAERLAADLVSPPEVKFEKLTD